MAKESFKASRIIIKDLPKDQKISASEMKGVKGGMLFRPELISKDWLTKMQRDSAVNLTVPFSSQVPQCCRSSPKISR